MRKLGSFVAAAALAAGAVIAGTGTAAAADRVVNGCTIVSQPTETRYTNCPQADFRGANLTNMDLSYANLPGADFTNATVDRIDVYKARLQGATFTDLTLRNVRMQNADLTNADLSRVVIASTYLGGTPAWMTFATLSGAKLIDSDLRGLSGDYTSFRGADLSGAKLSDALLRRAEFSNANLSGADLTYSNLGNSRFSNSTLTGANLTDAAITDASFSGTSLMPADVNKEVDDPGDGYTLPSATVSWQVPTPDFMGATLGTCSRESGSKFSELTTLVYCRVNSVNTTGLPTYGSGYFTVYVPLYQPEPGLNGSLNSGSTGSLGLGSLGS